MGAGYAVFVPADQAQLVVGAAQDRGLGAWDAGRVEAGTRQVTIEPAGVIFEGASLQLR
jgi:phosphoribosylformylglycinamidine cyclo-ligase